MAFFQFCCYRRKDQFCVFQQNDTNDKMPNSKEATRVPLSRSKLLVKLARSSKKQIFEDKTMWTVTHNLQADPLNIQSTEGIEPGGPSDSPNREIETCTSNAENFHIVPIPMDSSESSTDGSSSSDGESSMRVQHVLSNVNTDFSTKSHRRCEPEILVSPENSEPGPSGLVYKKFPLCETSEVVPSNMEVEDFEESSTDESSSSDEDFSSDDVDKDPNFCPPTEQEIEPCSLSAPQVEVIEEIALCPQSSQEEKIKICPINKKNTKRMKAQTLRNLGLSYIAPKSKKIVPDRKIGPVCCCNLNCSSKISEEKRIMIFQKYWALGCVEKQRNFLAGSMVEINPKYRYIRTSTRKKRSRNNAFYFNVENTRIRVCKSFFMSTLGISQRPIRTVLTKKDLNVSNIVEKDKRGKYTPHNKLAIEIEKGIKEHIDSIPRMPSHYCRANSKREYIDGGKTISELHRNYVDQCTKQNLPFAKYLSYYRIFKKDYDISFHCPKKDQCEDCVAYENVQDKENLREKYEKHLEEKLLSREEKNRDKLLSSDGFIVSVYDLQAVLQCPKGDSGTFYCVSKLNVFNFTVCQLGNNDVDCFVWHEGQARRGANEISTCVFKYLKGLNDKATTEIDVVFYSDNCCGQQKNKFMMALYTYAVQVLPNLRSVTHKFFIKGHSQNEGDSAHSVIERNVKRSLKSAPIYVPEQFVILIRTAKKTGRPYKVHEMDHTSFYDIKNLSENIGSNYSIDDKKQKIKLGDIKIMMFQKTSPGDIFIKTSYSDHTFSKISTRKNTRSMEAISKLVLIPLENTNLGVSSKKKEGLLNLFKKNQIPFFYKDFYESLKSY